MYRVIDLHCDTIPNMYSDFREGKEASLLSNSGRIDLNRMREGGYICQCFSLFTHLGALKKRGESPFTHVLGLVDFWKTQIAEYPDIIGQVTTAESMEENWKTCMHYMTKVSECLP